jgi:hypothetical protein
MESLDVLSPPRIEGGNVECLDVLPLIETWGNLMNLDVLLPTYNLNNLGNIHYLWSICYYKSLCTSLVLLQKSLAINITFINFFWFFFHHISSHCFLNHPFHQLFPTIIIPFIPIVLTFHQP